MLNAFYFKGNDTTQILATHLNKTRTNSYLLSQLQKKGQWSCICQQHKCYEFRVKNLHYSSCLRSTIVLCTIHY